MTRRWADGMLHVGALAVVVTAGLHGLVGGRALIAELEAGGISAELRGSVAIGWAAGSLCWALLGAIVWLGARRSRRGDPSLRLPSLFAGWLWIGFGLVAMTIRGPRPHFWIFLGMGGLIVLGIALGAPIVQRPGAGEESKDDSPAPSTGGHGSWMLFAALLLAATAGRARATELSNELHPSWSPDGRQIVFESDREGSADLWVLDVARGAARRITDWPGEEARPVWSPNGQWIAFHSDRDGQLDLWAIRPDGTSARRLTRSELDESNAAWDPGSRRIVYEEKAAARTWHLKTLDVDSLASSPLVVEPGSHLTPSWMADGRIAFSYSPPGGNHDTDIQLRVVDAEGRNGGELLAGRRGNSNVQYCPAVDRIVYNSIRDGDWEIYSASPDGSHEQRLTTSGGEGLVGIDGQPAWSPSCELVAITSGHRGSLDLVILRADGESERNLTSDWQKIH